MPLTDPGYYDPEFLCRAIGLIGFLIYVAGFFCLSSGRLDSTGPAYFALVLVASICVMISLTTDFNLSAALIQSFYICMSAGAIVLRWRAWRAARPKSSSKRTWAA